ncbi:MAG: DUF3352 domain-containing protein, partial [Candidatus Promineifilaceae bacterium]
MENKDDISTGKDTSEMQQSSRSPFGVLVAFLILLFICFIAAIVVLADPFDWDLLDSFKGTDNAALDSMPVDTGLYVELDMDRFTTTELARNIDPFLVLDIGLDYREFAEIMMELNNQMETSFGFNLTEDILPWIGPNVAVGLVDYEYDQYGSLDTAQALVVAEVKDDQAADSFVEKFVAGVSDESGNSFSEETYKGVTISELQAESENDRISIARADGIVYFGSSAEVVKRGIDASSGESLAEDEGYKTLEAHMYPERAVTANFSHDFIQDSTGGFGSDFPIDLQDIPYIGSGGGAVTLSFTDQGLRFDGLSAVDKEELTEVESLALQGSEAETAERFPSNTILYFTGLSISQFWELLLDASPDYAEAMAELQDQIGFDIVNELFVYLDGETGVGLWPGSSGLLANAAQIPLSFSLLGG